MNTLKVALFLVGTSIGAGFITGAELVRFFSDGYLPALFLSCLLYFCGCSFFLSLGRKYGGYGGAMRALFGRGAPVAETVFLAIAFVPCAGMLAGLDALLPDVPPTFGSCAMKVARRRAEPPEEARGTIARSVLYMAASYPAYRLNDRDRKLFEAWNAAYPPDAWECRRAERIRRVQGNANDFAVEACRRAGIEP